MAYKDEYEVARLFSNSDFQRQLDTEFSGDYHLQFHLAPPLLNLFTRKGKRPRKFAFGRWTAVAFKLLAKGKILRGTRFDPFGFSADRKLERSLIPCYESSLERMLLGLAPHNYHIAVQIAELPQDIRGFGPVKAAAIERVQKRERELFAEFERGPDVQIVKIFPRAA
jgi:indolepyruvate ferredoxin oxidoreductase